MTNDVVVKVVTGKAYWPKLGKPVQNYNKDGEEWTIDVSLDADALKQMKGYGLTSKIKNKGDERGDFITFKRATVKRNGPKKGEANAPIRVISPDGKTPWDTNKLIGNGSTVRVKFSLNETFNARTKEKGMRADPLAVQVYEHLEYVAPERQEFDSNPQSGLPNENPDW